VNKRALETLIKCGAFDFTGLGRGRLAGGIDFAMSRAASERRDRLAGQASLFDLLGVQTTPLDEELPPGEKWSESELLSAERELLGFYISGHPLSRFEWELKKFNLTDTAKLHELESGCVTRIGGLVSQFQKRFTKKEQKPMAVFRLEHLHGSIEVIVFPSPFEEYGVCLQDEAPVIVCGELSKDQDQFKIKAAEIYPLKDAHKRFTNRVSIHIPASELEESKLWTIKELLSRHPGDTPVTICLQFSSGAKVFVDTHASFKVAATAEFARDIEREMGEGSVYLEVNHKPCRKFNDSRKPWETRSE
jgi:DNA polymerase III subunit alpha